MLFDEIKLGQSNKNGQNQCVGFACTEGVHEFLVVRETSRAKILFEVTTDDGNEGDLRALGVELSADQVRTLIDFLRAKL